MSETNIIIAGVGGTGILTLSQIIANAAIKEGKNVVIGEIHGMSQRGGSVVSDVRIGDTAFGAIIPTGKGDILLGIEPIEAARNVYRIRKDAPVVLNTYEILPPIVSFGKQKYPDFNEIIKLISEFSKNIITINALELAEKAGSSAVMNIVILGAAMKRNIIPISYESVIETIKEYFPEKYRDMNIKAFKLGFEST